MHFGTTLISAQMLATVACAATLSEVAVSVLKDVCVAPASPEGLMAAGEERAKEENWKLLKSGLGPMPFMHNENGVKNSYWSAWEFDVPQGAKARLSISILRPEQPGVRHTVCIVEPTIDIDGDDLAQSIDRQFGSLVTKDAGGSTDSKSWSFTEEKSRGNCGKKIFLLRVPSLDSSKLKALLFTDWAYPSDGPWAELAKLTRCPN